MNAFGLTLRPRTLHSCLRQISEMDLSTACRRPLRLPTSFEPNSPLLSIVPAIPSHTDEHSRNWQEDPRLKTLERLSQLAGGAGLDLRPELYVEFESERPVSEKILETADKLRPKPIIMDLHGSAPAGVISHLDLATTYEVVSDAGSPVLTIGCRSGYDLRPRATEVTVSPWPEADRIRSHGFGVKW